MIAAESIDFGFEDGIQRLDLKGRQLQRAKALKEKAKQELTPPKDLRK